MFYSLKRTGDKLPALLGVQSWYSLHWGVASPAEWFSQAEKLGFTHLGIADHAGLLGLPEIVRLTQKNPPVKPLFGATFPFADGGSVLAFAANQPGYGNLCQGITDWHKRCAKHPVANAGGVPALDRARAQEFFREDLRCDGMVFLVDAVDMWRDLRDKAARTYWRIGPTLAKPPREVKADAAVFAPGPLLVAPDSFDTHRLLRAVGGATTLDRIPTAERYAELKDSAPLLFASPEHPVMPAAAYAERFAAYADALARAQELAEELEQFRPCRDTIFPPIPDDPGAAAGESAMARLRRLAYEGAAVRYAEVTAPVRERLEKELDLIGRKGFAEYFLVVHDIVARLAGGDGRVKRGRSVTCGRGSGAASLVNYCLGVTNVDVLKHDLMFERFLNVAREDPPDIDIDFAWDERDDVLNKVMDNYGNDRVARVANHNRYDWRGAFRAAARALGHADADITRHIKSDPEVHAADPHPGNAPVPDQKARRTVLPRAKRKLDALRARSVNWDEVDALARRLAGLPHGLSMHCGGVVVAPGVLARSAPTQISRKGLPTIQWEKDGAEDMGLVKIDLLGNRSLAVIRDVVKAVSADRGIPEDAVIARDPTEDDATRALIRRGNTFGVFYLESPSMRLLMAKAGRGDFAHAVIHSSIIRPAANNFINEYLRRLHGKPWDYGEECLKGKFDESYGVPVYQEDVVKLAMALCGYDYAKADALRKCLGKRDAAERLREAYPELEAAALARGVREETLRGFWRTLMSMTGYSFCKPHSASFAQVSYEAAYLRAHYPAYFIAAVLSNGGGFYGTQSYVSEAMRMGLGALGPDVNVSFPHWRAEGAAVRTGLSAISGLSRAAIDAVVGEREKTGPYRNLTDFLRRQRLAVDDLRRLALVGALDTVAAGLNRPQILWRVSGRAETAANNGGARTLFAPSGGDEAEPPRLTDYTRAQRWETEYSALGFVPGCHPLVLYEREIAAGVEFYRGRERPVFTEAGRIRDHVGKLVTFLAWPVAAKVVETRRGDAMMFQTFEDANSLCEAVVFPEEFRKYRGLLGTVQGLWVTGRVEQEFGVATVTVMGAESVHERAQALV